ncbi:MAG: TVP38/TMEM64 family protein [Alphaproteobacteria bacterium]
MTQEQPGPAKTGFNWRRLWPLALLVAGFVAFKVTGASDYVGLDALREHRETLVGYVAEQALLAGLIYVGLYAVVTAFSLPVASLISIVGGFLFGTLLGGFFTVVGATIGATVLFLAAKTALGDPLREKAGAALQRMEAGFRENAFSYLLVLRLVPLFPFFVVNLVPAFLGVSLRTYVVATFIGIIPGSLVYCQVGTGLGSVLDSGEELSLANIVTVDIVLALCGLAALAMVPVVYKWIRRRRAAS